MHNPESALENETYKILGNFEIKTDHLIPARRADLEIVKKKKKKKKKERTCRIVDFAVPADHMISEKRDKYLDLAKKKKLKTTIEYESDGKVKVRDTNCYWSARYCHQKNYYRDWGTWK